MEYSNGNGNFEVIDDYPIGLNANSETKRINQVAQRNRYNPQIMRIPETNYTTHYNNIQNVSPNYKTENQPHITNYEMNYPGYLEGKPVQNMTSIKYEAKDTNEYQNNVMYPDTSNLFYKKHSCLENYEHFTNCPLCSHIGHSNIKIYQVIIALLVLVIIFLALPKKK